MRWLLAALIAVLAVWPAQAKPFTPPNFNSSDAVLRWIAGYRSAPDPREIPFAMKALSGFGSFRDPERAGVYIGFLAGVIGSSPDQAALLAGQTLAAMHEEDRWAVIRAVAYSGLPDWKQRLRNLVPRIPERAAMIDKYINGKSATLDQLVVSPKPSGFEQFRKQMRLDAVFGKTNRSAMLEPSPEMLDVLWGYYFATGSYGPVMRMIEMLAWAEDHDDAERLTVGSMAKYSLANNAIRDQRLLTMLKNSSKARNQPKKTVAALKEIVEAAEIADTARIRTQAIVAVDGLKAKGPAYKRAVSWWMFVGQSAIAGGCVAAAVTGHVELGLPCVVGGSAVSAAMNFWNNQPQ
jgi:hypothetical protein